jgi:nucleotide-binding universal stress UspA family protein
MAPKTIISYDDTLNDHDALALGRMLGKAGATLELAYVRHTTQSERAREELAEHEAEALLERGARWLGDLDVPCRVVVSASTGEGLRWLAEQEGADVVVFGSDYRTAAGHVAPGRSAQRLIEGGPAAIAIAPANYRSNHDPQVVKVGVLAAAGDDSALRTARELAGRLDATITPDGPDVDLLVVGSRPEAPEGRVMITAQADYAIETSTAPVLIVPRGVAVRFEVPVAAVS